MYYYIFDVKKFKKRKEVENIKSRLNALGISGEYIYPSSAQPVVELVNLALSKQYTTIVAVGSDDLVNEVAGALAGKKEAMGIIPVDVSPELALLLGTDNWQVACEVLRYRKISEIKLGKTGNGYYFITSILLDAKQGTNVTVEFRDFILQAKIDNLSISNFHPKIKKQEKGFLYITLKASAINKTLIGKISSLFQGKTDENGLLTTLLHARSMRIFTKNQIPLINCGKLIAKTPQYIESTDEDLRLIVAKKASDFWSE